MNITFICVHIYVRTYIHISLCYFVCGSTDFLGNLCWLKNYYGVALIFQRYICWYVSKKTNVPKADWMKFWEICKYTRRQWCICESSFFKSIINTFMIDCEKKYLISARKSITGDIDIEGLGLSENDKKLLINEVINSIYFNYLFYLQYYRSI